MRSRGLAVVAAIAAWSALATIATGAQTKSSAGAQSKSATGAQTKSIDGDATVGRQLALDACTGCHVVASDQPYRPIYKGAIRPPDFKDIANKYASAASLRSYLSSLPAIPKNGQMANTDLTEAELHDVTAFIMTLRNASLQSSTSSR